MRSARVTPNTVATPNDYNALINDSAGAAVLLAHQMYGKIALPTNPSNTQTITLDINGTNVVITFVSSIGAVAGNVLIGASAAATAANLLQLLLNPTLTTATQVAIGVNTSANVTLINYINWSLFGTTIVPSSYNSTLYSPATSFSASTTATGGSYTANTMALYVEPGVVYVNGTEIYFAGGITPTVTAPVSHPRIDVLTLDSSGTLAWTTGTENASPVAPTYPANKLPICELMNVVSETILNDNANQAGSQGYILNDVRPFLQNSVILGALTDDLIPSADGGQNIGSPSFEWNNGYFKLGIFVAGIKVGSKFGGTGADGALSVSSGSATTINASGATVFLRNYTSISITGSAYVQCVGAATNGTAYILKSEGNVTLTSSAAPMLDASGCGGPGGAGSATNPGTITPNTATQLCIIKVPGATPGGNAGSGPTVGAAAVSPWLGKYPNIGCGSGGSGGGGQAGQTGASGGAGGGALVIECAGAWNFTTASGISVAGLAGPNGGTNFAGGGGGGGGYFLALYNTLTANSGTVFASGGAGGVSSFDTGGGGGNSVVGAGAGVVGTAGGIGATGYSLITQNLDY